MLFSIFGISIISVMICLLLKKTNPEFSMVIAIITGIFILGLIVLNMTPVFDALNSLMNNMHINNAYFKAVMKALGICYITQLAADTCRDAGYSAIAAKVELAGKICILIISLPLFENLIEIAKELLTIGS